MNEAQRQIEHWKLLASRCSRATPFQSPEWVLPHFEDGSEGDFEILDLPHGLAPITRKTKNGSQVVRLAGADYYDILAAPGDEVAAVEEFIDSLEADRSWKVADFRTLDPDGVLASGFANYFSTRRKVPFRFLFIPHQTYLHVKLPETWKDMEAQLGKKLAYQMRSAEGKRGRTFSSSVLRIASAETLEADIDAMVSLHADRAVTKGVSGMFADPTSIEKFKRSAREHFASDKLWLFTLWIEEKPVSALFCLIDDWRIYFYNSGFDKTFQKFHPVKVLIAEALKKGIAEGKKEFDFMKGDEPYKTEWANGRRTTMRLVFGRGLYGSMYLATLKYAPYIKSKLRRTPKQNLQKTEVV